MTDSIAVGDPEAPYHQVVFVLVVSRFQQV